MFLDTSENLICQLHLGCIKESFEQQVHGWWFRVGEWAGSLSCYVGWSVGEWVGGLGCWVDWLVGE